MDMDSLSAVSACRNLSSLCRGVLQRCIALAATLCIGACAVGPDYPPDGLHQLEPAGAVVSLVRPDATSDIRGCFCCHVHFSAGAAAADGWIAQHEGAEVVTAEAAFRLGQKLVRQLSPRALPGKRG